MVKCVNIFGRHPLYRKDLSYCKMWTFSWEHFKRLSWVVITVHRWMPEIGDRGCGTRVFIHNWNIPRHRRRRRRSATGELEPGSRNRTSTVGGAAVGPRRSTSVDAWVMTARCPVRWSRRSGRVQLSSLICRRRSPERVDFRRAARPLMSVFHDLIRSREMDSACKYFGPGRTKDSAVFGQTWRFFEGKFIEEHCYILRNTVDSDRPNNLFSSSGNYSAWWLIGVVIEAATNIRRIRKCSVTYARLRLMTTMTKEC